MKEAGCDGHRVEPHFRKNGGDFKGMHEVRLPRMPELPLVFQGRKYVGAAKKLPFFVRCIASNPFEQVFELDHAFKEPNVVDGV
jgi:hypothetical protein